MHNLLDIYYSLFVDFVRFYPKNNNPCLRLQTFAVIDRYSDLSGAQLNKSIRDYGKPYFYSREWENKNYNKSDISYQYPALVAFQNSFIKTVNPDGEKLSEVTFNLEIGVVDTFIQDCMDCRSDYCRDRTHTEIYRDTSNLLDSLFGYMQGVKAFDVVTEQGSYTTYKYEPYMKWLKDNGKVTSYVINRSATNIFQRQYRVSLGSNIQGQYWMGGQDNLRGAFVSLSISTTYCPEYEGSFYDAGSAQLFLDQNCCG